MPEALLLLAFITVQRLGELVWARANEKRLRAMGAVEIGAAHYPLIVLLHGAWVVWLWFRGWDRPLIIPFVIAFFVLQAGRAWVLATLGRRWTTRVLFVQGESLVKRGPFKLIPHPNYAVVAGEIAVLPLALHLPAVAVVFTILNAVVLIIRIRAETRALAAASVR